MKHAGEEIRKLAVRLYRSGEYSQQEVAKIVGYHYKTIQNWLRADAEGRPQVPGVRGHRKRALSEMDMVSLKALIDSGKYHTVDELVKAMGKASRSVIYRAVRELGYTYKKNSFCQSAGQTRNS